MSMPVEIYMVHIVSDEWMPIIVTYEVQIGGDGDFDSVTNEESC
jgi:hypothetical protein